MPNIILFYFNKSCAFYCPAKHCTAFTVGHIRLKHLAMLGGKIFYLTNTCVYHEIIEQHIVL